MSANFFHNHLFEHHAVVFAIKDVLLFITAQEARRSVSGLGLGFVKKVCHKAEQQLVFKPKRYS